MALTYPSSLQTDFRNGGPGGTTSDDPFIFKYPSYMHFKFYDRHWGNEIAAGVEEIYLYMPNTVKVTHFSKWQQNNIIDEGVVRDTLFKVPGGLLSKIVPPRGVATGVETSARSKLNPYPKYQFESLEFRSFDFSYSFTPKNEKECETIDEIIRVFRAASAPEIEDTWKMNYPFEAEIRYIDGSGAEGSGKNHRWLHNFKRCVIDRVDVNFAEQGRYITMRNGFPAWIDLKLKVTEVEVVDRNDILSGGY